MAAQLTSVQRCSSQAATVARLQTCGVWALSCTRYWWGTTHFLTLIPRTSLPKSVVATTTCQTVSPFWPDQSSALCWPTTLPVGYLRRPFSSTRGLREHLMSQCIQLHSQTRQCLDSSRRLDYAEVWRERPPALPQNSCFLILFLLRFFFFCRLYLTLFTLSPSHLSPTLDSI